MAPVMTTPDQIAIGAFKRAIADIPRPLGGFKRGEKPEFFTIWIDENETHRKTAKETKNDE